MPGSKAKNLSVRPQIKERGLTESLLIITGSMGGGKSTVLGEASDILTQRQMVHATIDVDALGGAHLLSATADDEVMYKNLESVCQNYRAAGIRRFLLARALEDAAQLRLCRKIVPAEDIAVCRITASLAVMTRRVEMRESGIWQRAYIARVAVLDAILDRSRLEHFTVVNENRSVTEVALEMLVKAGWITPQDIRI